MRECCLFCSRLPPCAQAFTNSATLNAALDGTGTNLVVRYSLMNTQGWVTLFQAGSLTDLATNAQPFDLAPAPGSGQGQFTVPVNPAAPSQFYRLLLEQWPSRGKALVWTNGPLDFAAMRATYGDITNLPVIAGSNCYTGYGCSPFYTNATTPSIFNPPVQVWIDNLGTYDTNGVLVGGNTNYLQGKYATTWIYSMNNASVGFPQINPILSTNNDFRVNYLGDTNVDPRTALLWSSQVQLYHDINDYRNRFFNDAFIDELNLPTNIAANVKQYQFRPDLNMGSPPRLGVPVLEVYEDVIPIGLRQAPIGNNESVWARTRGPYRNYPTLPPVSFCYDAGVTIGDYVGLMAFWVLGAKTGFPGDNFYGQINTWPTGVLAPINKGLSTWTAYRYAGDPEVFRYNQYAERVWSGAFFGGSGIPGDKGNNIRNVMMFDEQNLSEDGVFPYTPPSGLTGTFGPVSADLAGMYVAAIFYDIANDAGLGLHKTDLLFWKTLSVITAPPTNYTMRQFGASIQQAARLLWPDPRPVNAGVSLYENDLVDVLTSRGIPMNGVSDFRTNLPPAIGPMIIPSANNFASPHPASQPSVNSYNIYIAGRNGYTMTNSGSAYMALQIYKYSKSGIAKQVLIGVRGRVPRRIS